VNIHLFSVQQIPDLGSQAFNREGLLNEMNFFIQDTIDTIYPNSSGPEA
jgi:hypothetical protein